MSIINREHLLYRPCVGIALFNQKGEVFVGERIDTPGAWQMPQGGIDPDEEIVTAALRELEEEVGTANVEILQVAEQTICYDLPDEKIAKFWNGKYRGQEQTWIAARYKGEDCDINLNAFDPAEFSAWQWVELEKTLELIVPFKQETYKKVIALFHHLITD